VGAGNPANEADGRRDDRIRERAGLENRLRTIMTNMGLQETATQDALIGYLADDEKGKNDIRDAARRLMVGLKRELPPDRMKDLISAYKNSLENDKIRRRAAQASLDAKIGYSTNPRLEAILWVVGVLGDGYVPLQMGQAYGNRMPAPRPPGPNPTVRSAMQPGPGGADNPLGVQVLFGTLENKTDAFVEIRDQAGQLERYVPRFSARSAAGIAVTTAQTNQDQSCLDQLQSVTVGQKVRIEWTLADGRRLISIQPAPAATLSAVPPPAQEPVNP
jgi:hypothetical protein